MNLSNARTRLLPVTGSLSRLAVTGLLAVSSLFMAISPARADYSIASGDVVEIAVGGMPALKRRLTVSSDGKISYPLVGDVVVAGLTVNEVRGRLGGMLAERNLASNPDVTVEVVEYRPIYVMGDVLKPGAYPFRPGLSARNAIALAGGYDVQQLHGRNPLLEATTARGEYELAAVELAKQQARIARLSAELTGQPELDISALRKSSVRPDALAEIIRIENQQLKLDLESRAKDKDYYDRLRKVAEDQIAQVAQEEDYWTKSVQQQSVALNRNQALLDRSVGTVMRVDEAQQSFMGAQARLFDVRARLAQIRKDVSESNRKQDAALDQRRGLLLQDLRDAVVELTKLNYSLDVAADKMRLSGKVQSERGASPTVVIFEATGTSKPGVKASEDTMLAPGETLEVTFNSNESSAIPPGVGAAAVPSSGMRAETNPAGSPVTTSR